MITTTMLISTCSLKPLKIKNNLHSLLSLTRDTNRASFQEIDKLWALSLTLIEMADHHSWNSMTSRTHALVTEEWYIINQTTLTQTHNIMNLNTSRKVISSEDWRTDTADKSLPSTELALLDITRKEFHTASGSHTNLTENSHTHKESMREAHARPELKSQASWREFQKVMPSEEIGLRFYVNQITFCFQNLNALQFQNP